MIRVEELPPAGSSQRSDGRDSVPAGAQAEGAKKARRREAVLSVFQACSEAQGAAIPRRFAAIPLSQAVSFLLEDDRRIRQRALINLVCARVHERRASEPLVDELARSVEAEPEAVKKAAGTDRGRKALGAIFEVLPPLHEYGRAEGPLELQRRTPIVHVDHNPRSLVSTVKGKVAVEERPRSFVKLIDPRCWAEHPESQFEAAYRVEVDDWSHRRMDPDPDPIGEGWKGCFFEEVAWEVNQATQARFRNLLEIRLESNEGQIRADYRLYRSISSKLLLQPERPGGIDVDRGYFSARSLGDGWTEIEVEKALRYTDATQRDTSPAGPWDYGQTMNYLAPSLLGMFIDGVLTEVVEETEKRKKSVPAS